MKLPLKSIDTSLLSATLGLFLIIVYIYIRFLIPRLPKAIPYDLTFFSLLSLFIIVSIHVLTLISIFLSGSQQSPLLLRLTSKVYSPLRALDEKIKNHPRIKRYHEFFLKLLIKKLNLLNTFYNSQLKTSRYDLLVLTTQILPHIVLLSTLIVEIFLFQKISIFYKLLPLTTVFLIYTYVIYSLNQLQDKHTESLILLTQDQLSSSNDNYNTYILLKNMEEDDDKSIIHIIKPKLKVQETINHQILSIVHGKTDLAIQPFLPFFDYLESHGYITKNLKCFKNNDYKQVISFGHKEASVLFSYITNIGVFREELYLASNTTFLKKLKR